MATIKTVREQAVEALRALIEERYEPGNRLPAEPDLAKQMNLSRNTVREALAQLVHEGLLDRKWGVGTTVLPPRKQATFSVTDVEPIRQIIEASGHQPSLLRFHTESLPASPEVRARLNLDAGTYVLYIERLFAVDNTPAIWLRDWCHTHIHGVALDVSPLQDIRVDLPTLVNTQTGQILARLEGNLTAVARSEHFTVGHSRDTPLVQISQNVLTRDGLPVMYSILQFDTTVVDLNINRQFSSK